jgi:hypothetical protein
VPVLIVLLALVTLVCRATGASWGETIAIVVFILAVGVAGLTDRAYP